MVWTAVVVSVLTLAGSLAGWLRYAATYAPIGPGAFYGPGRQFLIEADGFDRTGLLLQGRPGDTGVVKYGIGNYGSHAVSILGLDTSGDVVPGTRHAAWAPMVNPDGVVGGAPSQVRPFPATVRPGQLIAVWVTFRKPHCSDDGGRFGFTEIPLRWTALGFHHEYRLPLRPYDVPPVYVCWPKQALQHLERRS